MSSNEKKNPPVLVGDNPTVEEHRINPDLLGTAYALRQHHPSYIPNDRAARMAWLANYVKCAVEYHVQFAPVFNILTAGSIYNATSTQTMFNRIVQAYAALDLLTPYQRGLTAYVNVMLFNRETGAVTPPRADPAMTMPTTPSPISGLIGIVVQQVDLLRRQPGFTEVIARQFGVLPTPAPSVDLETLDPAVQGRFTGGDVILQFRSPQGIREVDMAEVRVNRNDGTGVHLLGSTTHSRFTDHSDLPAGNTRAVWTYFVCFMTRNQQYVGQQSVVDVTVQGRVN